MTLFAAALGLIQAAVMFTTIGQGAASDIFDPREAVVRTEAEWQALWKDHRPREPVPAIDFSRDMVAGVFLGTRPTAGFQVEIQAVTSSDGIVHVQYAERGPSPGDLVAQVLTSPFHLVRVPRTDSPVEFHRMRAP